MLDINNLRFNYQEKNQLFGGMSEYRNTQKTGIGKLLSKYQRPRPIDTDQQLQIQKKKTVYHGNSLNYTQIYSDLQINRNQKIFSRAVPSEDKGYMFKSKSRIVSHTQAINISNTNYIPKSLPKLGKRSKDYQRSEVPKWAVNESVSNDAESEFSHSHQRNKSFSINHYDIYIQGIKNQKEVQEIFQCNEGRSQELFENSQIIQEFRNREPAIKVKFQNDTEIDMPEAIKSQMLSENISKMSQNDVKEEPILPEQAQIEPKFQDLQKEEIVLENPIVETEGRGGMLRKKNLNKRIVINTQDKIFEKKKIQGDIKIKENEVKSSQQPVIEDFESQDVKESIEVTQQAIKINDIEKNNITKVEVHKNQESMSQSSKQMSEDKKIILSIAEHKTKNEELLISNQKKSNKLSSTPTNKSDQQFKLVSKQQNELYRSFSIEQYMKIYEILKTIQTGLKTPIIDVHGLLRQIKKYLQVVASGSLDHLQGYDMPLHRLKIIKNSLLYERIAIVIISFCHAIGKIKQVLKYLINLIGYSTNNTLLILKILETTKIEKNTEKNAIIAKSQRLIMKRNFDTVRNNSDIVLDSINKISKADNAFHESFKEIMKSIGKNSIQQTFYNVLQYFAFYLCVSDLHMSIPFLAVAPNPYLKETIDDRPTLVVDIIQIFCHGTRKSKSHVFRPHSEHFLHEMSQYYELISFTCAYPNQIDKVIDLLDPKKHIKHRLYRHHAISRHQMLYKDTQRIGRDLNKLILLDSQGNIHEEINNTIVIPSWKGSRTDTTLAELCPILATIAIKRLNCIEATKRVREQQLKNQSAGIKYLNFGLNLS